MTPEEQTTLLNLYDPGLYKVNQYYSHIPTVESLLSCFLILRDVELNSQDRWKELKKRKIRNCSESSGQTASSSVLLLSLG